jgi:hypothetical protein
MSLILMVLGLLTTAVGAIVIGTGIPINEFNLGNTLILSGTVTLVSGLIIFTLSRLLVQLARIGDLLASRPQGGVAVAAEAFEMHAEAARPAPRPSAAARPRADLPLPAEVEPLRPPPPPAPRAAPPLPPAPPVPPAPEPHDDMLRAGARPAPEAAPQRGGWRPPRPATPAPTPAPEPRRPARIPDKAPELRAPMAAPPAPEPVLAEPEPAPPARPEPVSILKSGVVDGMAYTLYTDGSIEAELAQGVVRFGSIEELRNHLEKSA